MHLKSLVLKGFKSFADRSVLALEPGITAIVGPNGSGKSNISDAVLWVLGERNAKNLRGQAMEDVIFAGSSARRGVGLAEVDLVLDNTDMTLPVDFSEVALTRRMYRSGESEYLINGAPARRMDFMDILHDTGLGTGTHSIIRQGNLDAILASKPEDRRALIEEAAGVLKHKQRKERSARKLASMDAHLARVKDVADEVERQLKPLARKAARAEAYRETSCELEKLELVLAVDDMRALQKRWDAAGVCEREAAAAGERARARLEEISAEADAMQALLQKKGLQAGEMAARLARLQRAADRFESNAMLLDEKARGIAGRLDDARASLSASARRIARFSEDADALQEKLDALSTRRDAAQAEIDGLAAERDAISKRRAAIDAALAQDRSLVRRIGAQADAAAAELRAVQGGIDRRLSAKELTESKKASAAAELSAVRDELERLERDSARDKSALEAAERKSSEAREALDAASAAAASARDESDAARRAVHGIEGRIAALEALARAVNEEDAASAWLAAHVREFDGAAVPAASLIKAPRELEPLVERLLGDDVGAWCMSDASKAASAACALLDAGVQGTASILIAGPASREHSDEGGRLFDALGCDERIEQAMETLLGDAMLVDSTASALDRACESGASGRFVTREGVFVQPGAKIGIMRAVGVHDGALARERELEELRGRLAAALSSVDAADENKRRLDDELEHRRAESLACAQEYAQLKGAAENARAERERLDARVRALEGAAAEAEAALRTAERELSESHPRMEKLESAIEDARVRRDEAEARIAQALCEREQVEGRERSAAARLSEAQLQQATCVERIRSLERELEGCRADRARAERAQRRASDDVRSLEEARRRTGPLRETIAALEASARRAAEAQSVEAAAAQNDSAELTASIDAARRAVSEARERLDAAQAALSEARIEKGRIEVQVEAAIAAIVDERGVPLEAALETPAPENRAATEAEADRLRRRLRSIGTIDASAAQEYAAMKERHDFLASQIEDVEAARRALRRIVAAIDERMKERFDDAFERVDANFRSIFAQLFPGGSGRLSLVDLDGAGTLGVEVHAQPRGKCIAKMTLMSGGEKSLVAIALLFAVYGIRRTPFYILDEVEAALDDSNLRRLLAYLETLRHETQLIMITHQRRTMEMADVLYGVSMQADGVTKAVSQKLDRG